MRVADAPIWAVVPALGVLVGLAAAAAALDGVGSHGPRPLREFGLLLRQPGRVTPASDRLLWRVGTAGPFVVAALMAAVVPWGTVVVADLPVGVVWFNAMDVVLWAAVWLAGWGPNSVFSLVGGYRFLAQALAYELPLMFALTAPAVGAGSLRVADVVEAQQGLWYALWMPVAFVVFVASVAAFAMWGPFAAPLGADAAGGVLVETAGVDRLLLLAGRYALLAVGSAMAVALFLGGGAGPWLPAWLWMLCKTLAVLAALVAAGRLPVVHPERLVRRGWLVALPLVLLQVLVVSVVVLLRE